MQRDTNTPGVVYVAEETTEYSRVIKGDLFLCLFKSGDCFYYFQRMKETSRSHDKVYFHTEGEPIGAYHAALHKEAFPGMEPMDATLMLRTLVNKTSVMNLRNVIGREQYDKEKEIKEQIKELSSQIPMAHR